MPFESGFVNKNIMKMMIFSGKNV